jgi:glyoxylase-like metal-dependent hydrolase (beta-lactamase superfamily II)
MTTTFQSRIASLLPAIDGPSKIGPYELHTIETGRFALDGGAMFGIVPKTIWDKTNPSDELNRIDMRLRCLLLIERNATGGFKRVILVDNGIGTKWADKFLQIYKIDHSQWTLDRELARHGVKLEDVTDLVASHLHFDHMGGATRRVTHGTTTELIPTFPNARVWVQEQNWKLAYHPNEKDRASYLKENYDVYQGSSKLNLISTPENGREQILPNIFVRVSNGHTPGLQMIEVADEKSALIYCADAVPTATHVKVPFVMGYDCFPLTMIEEKKKLLREAEERGMMLFFEHCPRAEAATVAHDGKDYAVKQAYRFL